MMLNRTADENHGAQPQRRRGALTMHAHAGMAVMMVLMSALMGCSEDGNGLPDVPEACDGTTLSVVLLEPDPASGFAPFSVSFEGQVALIEDVGFSWSIDFGDGTTTEGLDQPSALHEYVEAGQYTVVLTVNDETCNKTFTASTQVDVQASVELTGLELTARPGNVQAGEEMSIFMDLVNEAPDPLMAPVTVSFLLSERPGVVWDQIGTLLPLANITLEPGPRGVTIDGNNARATIGETVVVPTSVQTGPYYVIAAIDPADRIGEPDNERNNLVVSSAPVFIDNLLNGGPDVLVENVLVGPTTVSLSLAEISINADLKNIGSRPADTTYAVFLQNNADDFDPEQAQRVFTSEPLQIDVLEPNNVFNVRTQRIELEEPITVEENAGPLEVCVWVQIDPEGELAEEVTDNNLARAQSCITVSDTIAEGIDIRALDFDVSPRETFLDGTVEVYLNVTNEGTLPTRSFFCAIYLSDDPVLDRSEDDRLTNINFSNLEPGESREERRPTFIPGFLPVGDFSVFADCDPGNVVDETFEDNNTLQLEGPFSIAAEAIIDLVPRDVEVGPLAVEDGGTVTATLRVVNEGETGASPSRVNLHLAEDGLCDMNDPVIGSADIPPLAADEDAELEIVAESLVCEIFQSQYNLCLIIETNNPEVNLDNNLAVIGEPLIINGERCQCQPDELEDNNTPALANLLGPGTRSELTLCDSGEHDYYKVTLEEGQSVTVRMSLAEDGDCTNLDMRMLTPDFQSIPDATSASDGALEQVGLFLVQNAGDYLIDISGRSDCDVNRYDLEITVATPEAGADLLGAGLEISEVNPALGEVIEADVQLLNGGQDDAAAFDVAFVLSADTIVDEADLPLGTLAFPEGLTGTRADQGSTSFAIPVEAVDGQYFVCAVLDSGQVVDENNEDNNVFCSAQLTVDTSCFDELEFNDVPEAAIDIEPGTFEALNVCDQGRQDNYRFCVDANEQFSVRADFVHRNGDIDMRLLLDEDGEFTELQTATGVRDFETLVVEFVDDPTCYIAQVYLNDRNATTNDYSLTLNIEPGDPANRCENAFEPNDTPETAGDLAEAIGSDLVLDRCPQDDFDFYSIDLVAGAEVTICADNHPDNAEPVNLFLTLLDPALNQLELQTGPSPCITRQIFVTGRYTVRLLAINQDVRSVRYTLSIDGLLGVDLIGRDLVVDPVELVPDNPDEVILYSFTLENARVDEAQDITYGLYYSVDPIIDPEEDLLITTGQVPQLAGLAEVEISDAAQLPSDGEYTAGEGYLGIFLDPDNTIDESDESNNRLQTPVTVRVCEDDALAGNDSPQNAAPIELLTRVNDLTLCPDIPDWFCFEELEGGFYSASIDFSLNPDDRIGSDLNMEVLGGEAFDESLGNALSIEDGAEVDFAVAIPGPVCVRVFGLRPFTTNSYSLIVTD